MVKTRTFFLFCFIMSGFAGLSTGQTISIQQKTEIEKQIASVFHRSIKSAEQLEFDQLSEGVDDQYKAGFISNSVYYSTFDSLIQIVKSRSQGIARQTITVKKEKITVLSETIVLLTATGEALVETSNGNTFSALFFWTFVYEKAGNRWKVIQSHQSTGK